MNSVDAQVRTRIMLGLQAPFYDDEVGFSPIGKGKTAPYVSRQTLENRLDDVMGIGNWEQSYRPTPNGGFICSLTLHLPDGVSRTQEGGGGSEKMQKDSHTEEAAMTNAFKSACRAWGVGRYLKGKGVPKAARRMFRLRDDGGVFAPIEGYPYLERPPEDVEEQPQGVGAEQWISGLVEAFNKGFAEECANRKINPKNDLFTMESLTDAILHLAAADGLTKAPASGDNMASKLQILLVGLEADEHRMDEFAGSVYQTAAKAALKGSKAATN